MPHRNRKFPYDPRLRPLASRLRKEGTLGEVLLWKALKGGVLGCEFHRQVPISKYIVDFYCHEYFLAVEVDGHTHHLEEVFAHDLERQQELEALGIHFLRFQESDVRRDVEAVVNVIREWLSDKEMK